MPYGLEIAALGDGWKTLQNRVDRFTAELSRDGIALVDFEERCLSTVFIPDRPEVIAALQRRKLLFVVRDGLAAKVYRDNPEARRGRPRAALAGGFPFARAALASMVALNETVGNEDLSEAERRDQQREGARRIAALARRHIERGESVAEMRAAMWAAYRPEVVAVLARYEAIFDPKTGPDDVNLEPPPERLPHNLPPHEKILALLKAAGPRGMWKADIRMRFQHPRPKAPEVAAMLAEIEAEHMIASAELALFRGGKRGMRYFHADYGLPSIADGVARFREEKDLQDDD